MTQIDHPIQIERPDLDWVGKNKRTCQLLDFVIPADRRVKESRRLRSVVANVHDSNIVSEFELQSWHCIHFRTNIIRKDMNPFILHPRQQFV